ncbi:MAG: anti-sigma factor family protein [Candidatus Rokuibacteriota bacterium]
MTCEPTRARLFEYLDGELTHEDLARVEEHASACAECRHLVELERAFREIYSVPLRPDPAPALVQARVATLLADLAPPRPWRHAVGSRRAVVTLVCAALVLVGALVGLLLAWAQREASATSLLRLADASVDQHQKLARGILPFDIARVPPGDAERWFRSKLDFNVRLPELKDDRLTFVGGRIAHLTDFEVAALEYLVDQHNVTLFIIPTDQYDRLGLRPEPRFKLVNRQGYDVIVWNAHGAAYALVSEIGGRSCAVCHASEEHLDVTLKPEVHSAR